ncbi:MAG: GntR family transcriptional regulator [Propionicimonas sp.]|uniref:GntR family transcriptional regulator n=1 Tax=Propionicimonas sp. TaxID=1955623 RepID=UPI002B1F86E3|nr:GntR family transcriptional regulator [Propionicimonas sp.]MEA4945469.1 GntR family transcriptional regulator [Propionicimonas sp.]
MPKPVVTVRSAKASAERPEISSNHRGRSIMAAAGVQLTAADLDRSSPTPIHQQVAGLIRGRIASGVWPVHYRLHPEPELATELGISRGTLRKAIAQLIREGRLRQVRGRGTFVTSTAFEPGIGARLSTLSEDLLAEGITLTSQVRAQQLIAAPASIAALLEIPAGELILRLERLRSSADGPVALLFNDVRRELCPGIEDVDFSHRRLFDYLETDCRLTISHGRRTFNAAAAPPLVAAALQVPPATPILYLEQITYLADRRPVEYSDVWIHPDRMRISALLPRR